MATARIVITKQAQFQGLPERWSNGYNFQTGSENPPTEAQIDAAAAALIAGEKGFHAQNVSFPYANGGLLGSHSVYAEEFTSPETGGMVPTVTHPECCLLAEWKMRRRVYLRKWYHTYCISAIAPGDRYSDNVVVDQLRRFLIFLTDGSMPLGWKLCAPNGALTVEAGRIDPFIRMHQFRARGKRPQNAPSG